MSPSSRKMASHEKSRRRFLKNVALGMGAASIPVSLAVADLPGGLERKECEPALAQAEIEFPRRFSGTRLKMLSFPLGGVGAGSISLGGRGELKDWSIFNRPDNGKSPTYAFPAIRVHSGNRKPVTKVLEARIIPPYQRGPLDLGWENVPGLPRLESCTFMGEYPMARVDFEDPELPVRIYLEAFTPFIPLDPEASGLPVAILRYTVSNPKPSAAQVSIAFSIDNPVGREQGLGVSSAGTQGRENQFRKTSEVEGLLMQNPFLSKTDPLAGTFALAILGPGSGKVSYLRGWPSARWWESPWLYWEDFSRDGELGPETVAHNAVGVLCLQRKVPARGKGEFTFLLSWHFPNRTPKRCGWAAPKDHENDLVGNYYSSRFPDAWAVAEYTAQHLSDLETRTRRFLTAMRETTLPGAVRDAAMSNLSTLAVQTSFRTADGRFHGFEGCQDHSGCCFGSCTHVYGYEAAIAHIFPSLSRSLREQQFGFLTDEQGLMDYREFLPYGIEHFGVAAADGQMACIMKLYLDWRLSGDTEWLRQLWPRAKRALEFAWIKGGWDANRDGVMEGVQHNTYDVEFVGPNPLCGIWYLGALRAGEEMAKAVGDHGAAEEYHKLFQRGSAWIDANLFNGEFYIQKIGSIPQDEVARGLIEGMGSSSTDHPSFQLGNGCLVDQLVGQYVAQIAGLGLLLDRAHIQKTLESIYKYNYKRTLRNHACVMRTFALNDEAALVICDYPHANPPKTPFPYFQEVMTGFEYSAAILMLYMGMVSEGVELISNVRRRYDGEKRNAWDEAECGHHYARAMASWAGLLALSGFSYHAGTKTVTAIPQIRPENFLSFWSCGTGWGTFSQHIGKESASFSLTVGEGQLVCRSVELEGREKGEIRSRAKLGSRPIPHKIQVAGDRRLFIFPSEITIEAGDELTLNVDAHLKTSKSEQPPVGRDRARLSA
jgi:uncharacterized protein (DUF608 family)